MNPAPINLPVFDAHHPPDQNLLSECVHCGFCLQTCPTYRLWGREADSPRGRIYLMQMGLNGDTPMDAAFVGHFDRCLGCMACLTSCPSGVKYDRLIEATRAQIERRFDRPAAEKFFRRLIFAIFPYPRRLRVIATMLWVYQRSRLQKLMRRTQILKRLSPRLAAMESLMPEVRLRASHEANVQTQSPRLRLGLMLGCVQRVFFSDVNAATARVLAAEGCEVVIPSGQGCCGALMTHSGEESSAMAFARRMIDAFEGANVDVIAINAAGCGSAMKEYGHLLRDDVEYAGKAKAFAAKCKDISEVLTTLPPRAQRHPLPLKVAYHDACHLAHAQRVSAQPRDLLKAIPGLELVEIDDGAICCGSAGIYNLLQPQAAGELGRKKAANVVKTGAAVVASGNPGCTLQIAGSLRASGNDVAAVHWVQLLDASIRGGEFDFPASGYHNRSHGTDAC